MRVDGLLNPLVLLTSMPDKETIQAAYEEFRAILAGGQNNREFYLSARVVCEFFDQLLREQS